MSFYTSLSGLKGAQADLDVISQNIANSETNGFKRSRVDFADIVVASASSSRTDDAGIGVRVDAIDQDFAIGPIEQTGRALDVAIGGDGFFTTVSPRNGQTYFTRNGGFDVDGTGYVVDRDGNRLQMLTSASPAGPPVAALVPPANAAASPLSGITISTDGAITGTYADGSSATVGSVALASFVAATGLRDVGSSNWEATGKSGPATYGLPGIGVRGDLQVGSLERSNVDLSEELVNLITAQRYFQANAKAVDTATQISQTIINLHS